MDEKTLKKGNKKKKGNPSQKKGIRAQETDIRAQETDIKAKETDIRAQETVINPQNNEDASLSKDYNMGSLFMFVLPSIFTFVFIAVYQIVDGIFISKFSGPYAIAAVNLYYPIISLLLALGMMIGTGGNAMIVELLGRGKREEADRIFSETLLVALVLSIVFAVVCVAGMNPIMNLLGATEGNVDYLRPYYLVLSICAPAIMFQTMLGIFIIGEGRTVTTGVLIIIGGVLNIVLDYVFMGPMHMGTLGAAIATVIGYIVPVLYAFWFYSPIGASKYHIHLTKIEFNKIGSICYNGSSEMVSNLAAGVTALFMNRLAFQFCGEVGVSVVSVFLYVQFIVMAIFMGMTTAAEPLFSYHMGSGNVAMRKKLFRLCVTLTAICSVVVLVVVALFYHQITGIFFKPEGDSLQFYEMTCQCILFILPACVFVGFNIFASGLFTAFSNGLISAVLSATRTFVILTICIFGMSYLFKLNGLRLSWGVAEALSLIVSLFFIRKYHKQYFE